MLLVIISLLSLTLYVFIRKNVYISDKEKEFIFFVIDIFRDFGSELGIQSKEQHEKLVEELEKIKNKYNKKL